MGRDTAYWQSVQGRQARPQRGQRMGINPTSPSKKRKKEKMKSLSCVQLFVTSWTVAYQASLSMGFSRQEYWSELPFPSPGDLPDPEIEPMSPALEADALTSEPPGKQSSLYTRVFPTPRPPEKSSCLLIKYIQEYIYIHIRPVQS